MLTQLVPRGHRTGFVLTQLVPRGTGRASCLKLVQRGQRGSGGERGVVSCGVTRPQLNSPFGADSSSRTHQRRHRVPFKDVADQCWAMLVELFWRARQDTVKGLPRKCRERQCSSPINSNQAQPKWQHVPSGSMFQVAACSKWQHVPSGSMFQVAACSKWQHVVRRRAGKCRRGKRMAFERSGHLVAAPARRQGHAEPREAAPEHPVATRAPSPRRHVEALLEGAQILVQKPVREDDAAAAKRHVL